jgi:flavin-binding protein dodecin
MPARTEAKDHIYKILELVGSSDENIEDAIQNAISRASKTIRGMKWFEVLKPAAISRATRSDTTR